jgi:hypothetical protein
MERAQRRLFVTHPKRQVGNKVYGGNFTFRSSSMYRV